MGLLRADGFSLVFAVFISGRQPVQYLDSKLLKREFGILKQRLKFSEDRRAAIQEMQTLMANQSAVGPRRLSFIDGTVNSNRPTILLVEDEKLLHYCYKPEIEAAFPETHVCLANNGAEAWAEINKKRPCLVIMDIFMPVMNGYELFQKLSLHYPDIPVLAVSGYVERAEVAAKINVLSHFEFLRKPFLLADLISAIGRLRDGKLPANNDCSIAA